MSYFRLLNEHSVEKALRSLFSDLAHRGALHHLTTTVMEQSPAIVELPGFDLFTSSGSVKPYTWFLPKPKVTVVDTLRIYEQIAFNSIASIETAGSLAGAIYPRNSEERKAFLKFNSPSQWLSPALMFAAAAQWHGVDIESKTSNGVRMRLGNGVIDINRRGFWSNIRRSFVVSEVEDDNPDNVVTYFPPKRTSQPVLKALFELCDGYASQMAVTALAHAVDEAVIGRSVLGKIGALEHPLTHIEVKDREKAALALAQCDEILDSALEDVVKELYDAAIPNLVSRRQMQSRIPAPSGFKSSRKIRDNTLREWRVWLHKQFDEIPHADA